MRALNDGPSVEQLDAKPATHVGAVIGELYGVGSRVSGAGEELYGVRIGGVKLGRAELVEGGSARLGVERGVGCEAGETVGGEGGGRLGEDGLDRGS